MYDYYQFDEDTFVVFNTQTQQEICICSVFETEDTSAEQRAKTIADLLNEKAGLKTTYQKPLEDQFSRAGYLNDLPKLRYPTSKLSLN
ncbi:MAG: hypothetical protein HC875_32305 [Anaerolineales bacterium]|nr:hypothetical protein [Anaerolineales bacterium]